MNKILKRTLKILSVTFILANTIVAFHAYKFTHFYDAGTVKPIEQQTKWDGIRQLFLGLDFQKQRKVAPDTAVNTIYLTNSNNEKLEAWFAPVPKAKGTVIMFHGHGGQKSGNNAEAAEFRKLGYSTLQLDFRAHGGSEGNTCTIGVDEAEDVKLAYDYVRSKDSGQIIAWGISMGAAAITATVERYEDFKPSKIILEMPFASLQDAVKSRMAIMGLPEQPLTTGLTLWGGTLRGFWAFGFCPHQYAKKIDCPTLLQWGRLDKRVGEHETNAIYKNIGHSKKSLTIFENSGHQSLCVNENQKWVNAVITFLE